MLVSFSVCILLFASSVRGEGGFGSTGVSGGVTPAKRKAEEETANGTAQ